MRRPASPTAPHGDYYLPLLGIVDDFLGMRFRLSMSRVPIVQNPDIGPGPALERQVKSAEHSVAIEKQPGKGTALLFCWIVM